MAEDLGKALDFDSEISKENDFELIPDGDYTFTVKAYERGQYEPKDGAKMCACPMVSVTLGIRIADPDGSTAEKEFKYNLFLNTKAEGRISEFFEGVGLKKKGDKFKMAWNSVIGKTGKLKMGRRKGNTGDNEFNDVKKFYYKDPGAKTYTPGAF